MKKIKRLFAALSAAVAVVLATIALAACGANGAEGKISVTLDRSEQKLVVITADATNETKSLKDALDALNEKGELAYEIANGMIVSVNGYLPDGDAHEFWAIYTSLGEYKSVSYSNAEWGTYEYEGATYASAAFGAEGLPLVEGNTYLLVISVW